MSKKRAREDRSQTEGSGAFNPALASLGALRSRLGGRGGPGASDEAPSPGPGAGAAPVAAGERSGAPTGTGAGLGAPDDAGLAPVTRASKIVVRKEKKGRGGKTVTRVDGLEGSEEELAELARALARALGCGGAVEGGAVLVQGHQTPRVAEWLRARGAKRVVIGDASA